MVMENPNIREDLIRLREELIPRAFYNPGTCRDANLAEIVFKINSVLYKGYPRRKLNK